MFKFNIFNSRSLLNSWFSADDKTNETLGIYDVQVTSVIDGTSSNVGSSPNLKPSNQVIALSDDSDDFVQVQLKKLSYAEVAALSTVIEADNDNKLLKVKDSETKGNDIKVVDEKELESEITDFQMADILSIVPESNFADSTNLSSVLTSQSVSDIYSLQDSVHADGTIFNDKINRRAKKAFKKKKNFGKKVTSV